MTPAPLPDEPRALLLALLAEPREAYRADTAALERAIALTPGEMHGRREPCPVLAALLEVRHTITATLEIRRRLAVLEAEAAQARAQAPAAPAAQGGTKVPTNPPRPGPLPPVALPEPGDTSDRAAMLRSISANLGGMPFTFAPPEDAL